MSAEHNDEITDRRNLVVQSLDGKVEWHVNEFNGGHAYILTVGAANGHVHFGAHFTGEQWAEFQALVAGGQS